MRKTAAWNVMGMERSTQAIAEEAARRAGMSLANWLDEVVAEQATEQGVAAEDLTEDDRLDAIGERIDQLSRREKGFAPEARERRARSRGEETPREKSSAERANAESRVEAAIAKFESRASRNEERTAKALESVAQWIERNEIERAKEGARREPAVREAPLRERYEPARRDDAAERSPPEARRAEPAAPAGAPRSRLDLQEAVQRIQRRRGELDARQGVDRPAPRREIEEPLPAPPAPARVASSPVQARAAAEPVAVGRMQSNGTVDALRDEIVGLNSLLDRISQEQAARAAVRPETPARPATPAPDRRLTSGETESLRAELAAMRRALTDLAPRNANAALEGAVVDLGQRLEAMRKAAVNGEAMRPLEDLLRQMIDLLRRQDPQSVAKGVENDLKVLGGRIDALARAAVDPGSIEQIRRQTEDVRQMLAKAADGAPIAKLERQIEHLADRAERLSSHPAPQPEIERLVAMFAETRTQIERAVSPVFLKTIEQRLESLSTRIDDALKRPSPAFDPRPIEELARRFDHLKTVVERQAETAPAGTKLEAAIADIGRRLDRPAPAATFDARPFEELARRVESLKSAVEQQGAIPASTARLEVTLAEIGKKLERVVASPTFDPRPVDELARRFEILRATVERQAASPASTAKLETGLAEISQKLERLSAAPALDARPVEELSRRFETLRTAVHRQVANPPSTAKLEAALAEIGQKLERATAPPTVDTRPIEELSRRFETLRTAVERQAATPSPNAKLEAGLAEIGQKLERLSAPPMVDTRPIEELSRRFETLRTAVERQAATPAPNAKLEAGLAEIGQKLERLSAPPMVDTRPIEDLSRRFETLRTAVERQAATPAPTAKLEAGLAEIGQKLERMSAPPTVDTRPIEDLSRRFESLKSAVERQAATPPATAKLEAAMAEISRKLELVTAAPTVDTRPIEDLSRRFESLRSAVEQQATTAPGNPLFEAALADINRKLDRPAPATARDTRPMDDLTQQVESLRVAVNGQAEAISQGGKLEAAITEIGRKLDRPPQGLADQLAIKSTLQALSARVEEGFRKIGSAPADSAKSVGALELELLDEIARGLEDMRAAIDRHGDLGASASRLEAAIADLTNRMEGASEPASDRAALNETLQLLLSRLEDWGPPAAPASAAQGPGFDDLTSRIDALHASLENHSEIVPHLSSLSAELAEIRERLDAQGDSADHTRALVDVVQDLSDKIERRDSSASDLRALETLAREVLARPMRVDTSSVESMIEELSRKIDATAGSNFDLAPLVEWMTKIERRLEAIDPASYSDAIRDLGERIEAREPAPFDPRQAEETATLIAHRLEPLSGLGADAEVLLQQLSEIHERLDALAGASGSGAALEKSVADLAAEFDNTRQLLASVVEPAALASGIVDDIADLKAEHANAERRMSTRLTRVQEILEQLSDRLRLIEAGQDPDARPARPAAPPAQTSTPAGGGFDFNEIPDRPRAATARLAAVPPAPPQAARASAEPSNFLLEPGAGAPRGAAKKSEEPRRATGEDDDAPKTTDLQAHIAAARRAAMAEMNLRREQTGASGESALKRAGSPMAALKQAQGVVANRRVPFLVGAVLLVAGAAAALYELRGGHLPLIQRSDIPSAADTHLAQAPAPAEASPAPAIQLDPKDAAPAPAPKIDFAPTGAVDPAKSQESAAKAGMSSLRAPADLVAAVPSGQPDMLKSAAIAGDPGAETELGVRYVEGRSLARDPKIGARWLELAATQGAPYAQYRIGALYERGVGVVKDVQLARAWYKKAANAGNARAMHNLAVMDADDAGDGKPDYAEAAAGFRSAGEFGVRDSQYNLGVLYGRGLGVPQDLAQAWMWFSLAAQQGDGDAAKKRDEVAAKLDAKQLNAAAKLLTDFKVKTPSPAANEAPQPAGGWEAKAASPQAAKPAAPAGSPMPIAPGVKS